MVKMIKKISRLVNEFDEIFQGLNIQRGEQQAMKDGRYKVLYDAVISGFEQFRNRLGLLIRPPKMFTFEICEAPYDYSNLKQLL